MSSTKKFSFLLILMNCLYVHSSHEQYNTNQTETRFILKSSPETSPVITNKLVQALKEQHVKYRSRLLVHPILQQKIKEFYQDGITQVEEMSISQSIQKIDIQKISKYRQAISAKKKADIIVHEHPISHIGYGVFANRDIVKGDFIGEYTGELKPIKVNDDNAGLYAWDSALARPKHATSNWIFVDKACDWPESANSKNIFFDAKKNGNELRFINHNGSNANCVCIFIGGEDKLPHLCYIASKDFSEGQELTVDYGTDYKLSDGSKPVDLGLHNLLRK